MIEDELDQGKPFTLDENCELKQIEDTRIYVIIQGNGFDEPFQIIGPFKGHETAVDYAEAELDGGFLWRVIRVWEPRKV